jgi:hypothetical protein
MTASAPPTGTARAANPAPADTGIDNHLRAESRAGSKVVGQFEPGFPGLSSSSAIWVRDHG